MSTTPRLLEFKDALAEAGIVLLIMGGQAVREGGRGETTQFESSSRGEGDCASLRLPQKWPRASRRFSSFLPFKPARIL